MEIQSENLQQLDKFPKAQLDSLLQKICQLHSAKPYKNNQNSSGFKNDPGFSGDKHARYPTRLECGQKLFSNIPADQVIDLFIALFNHISSFNTEFAHNNRANSGQAAIDGVDIELILVQSFFVWMENYDARWRKQKPYEKIHSVRLTKYDKDDDDEEDGAFAFVPSSRTPSPPNRKFQMNRAPKGKLQQLGTRKLEDSSEKQTNAIAGPNELPKPNQGNRLIRVVVFPKQRQQLIDLLIPLEFTKGPYIWKTIVGVLELKSPKNISLFAVKVLDAVNKGLASFSVVQFCLSHQNFASRMAIPKLLIYALLLGPLDALTVEQFVANRSDEFREETRRLFLLAETWKSDEAEYQKAAQEYANRSHHQLAPFSKFCERITLLMGELKNEMPEKDNLVSDAWAHSLVKGAAKKFYLERTWSKEQFNDLVHTLLVQRPTLKAYLLNILLKDHGDKAAFDRWKNFISTDRIHMSKNFEKHSLHSTDECPEFLSLPRRCEVYVIGNIQQFRIFNKQFGDYEQKRASRIVVGVDAEWNSYVMRSRASLLQVALNHSVYLLDLDALHVHQEFLDFIDHLFMGPNLVKIGYQFGDDLIQLRIRLPQCIGLYRPSNIYCIGRIVDELCRRSKRVVVEGFSLDQFILPITDQEEEAMKEHTRQVKPGRRGGRDQRNGQESGQQEGEEESREGNDAAGESTSKQLPFSAMKSVKYGEQGLSYLCRRVLGKPLNKQEQCSVWDRRPLRSSQVRYAALDAHALLQLYNRCCEWSQKLGLGDDLFCLLPIVCMNASLPLFWDKPLPKELVEKKENNNTSWPSDDEDGDGWGATPNNPT